MTEFLISIVPSAGVVLLFWLVLRAILQADRRERAAVARFDAEQKRSPAESGDSPAAEGAPAGRPD